jgi:endonuclease III related protein
MNRTMPTFDEAFKAVRAALVEHSGSTAAGTFELPPFEGMIAVLLERGGAGVRWRSALEALAESDLVSPERLAQAEIPEILDALREKGITATARSVAPLKHLGRLIVEKGVEGILAPDELDTGKSSAVVARLRDELAATRGIGPAAADAIMLFALNRTSYPVDRASFRVLVRHGWLDSTSSYEEARDLIVERAMNDADELEEQAARDLTDFSRGMAQIGRQFCRAAAPRCLGCPLENLLPEGGPREVDA